MGSAKGRVKAALPLLGLSLMLAGCGRAAPGGEAGALAAQQQPQNGAGGKQAPALAFGAEQRIGRAEADPAWPFLRVGPDGRIYIVWTEKDQTAAASSGAPSKEPTGAAGGKPAAQGQGHAGHGDGASGAVRAAFMAASADGGRTWSEPVRINDKPENVQGDENEAKIAFGRGGRIYAAWAVPNDKGDKMRGNIRFAMADESGRFGSAKTLNEVKDAARFPALQTGPDGTVYVAWIDRRVDSPAPRQIYMTRISPSGTVLTTNYKIAEDSCECCRLTMAFADGGKTVYVAYRQKRADNVRNIVVRKSADGGATFGDPVVVSDDGWQIPGCPHAGAVMATDARGNVHVVWYTYGRKPEEAGIYYSVSRDGGRTFAPRRLVHAAGAPEVLRPYLAVGEQGDVYLAWMNVPQGQDRTQIFFRRLAADGETMSPVQQISETEGNAVWPTVAVSRDRVYVAWTETKGEDSWVVLRAAAIPPAMN